MIEPSQWERAPACLNRWVARAHNPVQMDPRVAREAACRVYSAAGLSRPRIAICSGPLSALFCELAIFGHTPTAAVDALASGFDEGIRALFQLAVDDAYVGLEQAGVLSGLRRGRESLTNLAKRTGVADHADRAAQATRDALGRVGAWRGMRQAVAQAQDGVGRLTRAATAAIQARSHEPELRLTRQEMTMAWRDVIGVRAQALEDLLDTPVKRETSVRDLVRDDLLTNVERALQQELGVGAWQRACREIRYSFDDQIAPIRHVSRSLVPSPGWADQPNRATWLAGNLDGANVLIDFLRNTCALVKATEPIVPVLELARCCSFWIPHEEAVVMVAPPKVIHRDQAGALHCEDGPALAFADGSSAYALHGVLVAPGVVMRPQDITSADIDNEPSCNARRIMLDMYGVQRYVEGGGAIVVHQDATGSLYRKDVAGGDEPVVMVRVTDRTPEPNGTYREYWLRVPPTVQTAREAVAWTFGLEPDAYQPSVET